jgi:F-type H+-transporting ATPase subunit c
MSTTQLLAQGITDSGLIRAGGLIAGGLALAGGAIGAATGNGSVGAATVEGITRQPEARGRLYQTMLLIVSLCESVYFINLAFMAVFVFALG